MRDFVALFVFLREICCGFVDRSSHVAGTYDPLNHTKEHEIRLLGVPPTGDGHCSSFATAGWFRPLATR
jgi:hypothetical protein